ncbi:hypothetical protein [Shewanella sp. SE1]|uniref:hypothetical protein n=1 Tax=Shewanella sp. SE1 TaxID=2705014 RepID=UPI00138F2890|nr:hypothetical protein [Shewanella sp. SE1]NDO75591.1 hypothetical protein [Shewanella sp. SE1]
MFNIALLIYVLILVILLLWVKRRYPLLSIYPLTLCYMLCEVPFLFISYYNPEILYQSALAWVNDLEDTYILHLYVRMIFICCFSIVCLVYKPIAKPHMKNIKINSSYVMLLLLIVFASYFAFLFQVGGLAVILGSMAGKTELIRGSGITRLFFVYSSLVLASVSVCYYANSNRSVGKTAVLISLLILMFLMLASYGERKNSVVFLIIFALSWNLWVKPISIVSFKFIVGVSVLIVFSALAPPLREAGAAIKYALEPTQLFYDAIPHLGELFRRFSDIDLSIFIFNYFDSSDRYFYLSTLPNLFYGVIPSFLYPNKPPVDEAVFIYNLANGINPGVDAPFHKFLPVGWPVSRYTSGWVQFGIWGVVVYSIFTSIFLIFLNNITLRSNSPFVYPLYVVVAVTGFGISNAYIFNFLISVIVVFILYISYRGLNALSR